MNSKLITGILLAVGIVVWVAWDFYAAFNKTSGDTISELFGTWIKAAPILAMVLGVVMGHLVGGLVELKPILQWVSEHPVAAFAWGFVGGMFAWNMQR